MAALTLPSFSTYGLASFAIVTDASPNQLFIRCAYGGVVTSGFGFGVCDMM